MDMLHLQDYSIYIGPCAQALSHFLNERQYAEVFLLADEHTEACCLPLINGIPALDKAKVLRIQAGERFKNLETCSRIWSELLEAGAGRKGLLINLGGGVIGDMGGFCASTYKRGMDFVQIPTTLLSQVDASIGGKLGIDFHQVKNSIGVFANPQAVFVDPAFLETLPFRELRSGYAEIVKHALIADAGLWSTLKTKQDIRGLSWLELIMPSLQIKKRIVEADPFEKNLRKALNFGHTIGHAMEAVSLLSAEPVLHGEAIAAGMICEAWLSQRYGFLDESGLEEIASYLIRVYQPSPLQPSSYPAYFQLMRNDKKNEADEINFTFIGPPGMVHVNQKAGEEEIRASFAYLNEKIGNQILG